MDKRIRPLSAEQQAVIYRLRRGRKLLTNIFGEPYFEGSHHPSKRAEPARTVSMRTLRVLLAKGLIRKLPVPGKHGIDEFVLAGLPAPQETKTPDKGQTGTV